MGNQTSTDESGRVPRRGAVVSSDDPACGQRGRPLTQVLVVEDQRALAGALQVAIDAQPDLNCVGAVGTAEEAIALVAARIPDVALMDIGLPGTDGIEGTRQIKASHPQVRVLILTANAQPDLLSEAAKAGAAGFLAKDSPFPDILKAIRTPVDGKILVESPRESGEPDQTRLTTREREVLALLGEGLAPRMIAQRLVVSPHTARGHVKNIMMKLGAHSQLEAVVMATQLGFLPRPLALQRTRHRS
jgi:DNA-binding NarL/FixJ family response regulator